MRKGVRKILFFNGIEITSENEPLKAIEAIKRSWTFNKLAESEKLAWLNNAKKLKTVTGVRRNYSNFLKKLEYNPRTWSSTSYVRT